MFMILCILAGMFIFFRPQRIIRSFCGELLVEVYNETFTNYENACNSPGRNGSSIDFLFSKDFWPWAHALIPYIIHAMFSTFIFGFWKYKYNKKTGKYIEDKTGKWRTATVPHVCSFCITFTICAIWEYIEQALFLAAVDVFMERPGDSLGDMINPTTVIIFINILIGIGYADPPAMILRFLGRIEFLVNVIMFLVFALSTAISIFDFVMIDNTVVHAGYLVCVLVMVIILLYWREFHRKFARSVKVYDEWVMEYSWFQIFGFLIIMWGSTIQLFWYTYIELAIGLILYAVTCLFFISFAK
jgi:hypothetical protein